MPIELFPRSFNVSIEPSTPPTPHRVRVHTCTQLFEGARGELVIAAGEKRAARERLSEKRKRP